MRSVRALAPALEKAGALPLYDRLVARDEQALVELIEVATPWLLGIAQALLADPDDAEEVVQEAFTTVWNKVGRVPEEPRGLLAWLLRVTRNASIDRLRARQRRQRKASHFAGTLLASEPSAEPEEPNEAHVPGWHVHRAIHAALQELPPDQQTVVALAYFQGLTQSAIARELGVPLGTVKTRLRLAFQKLRLTLEPLKDWMT